MKSKLLSAICILAFFWVLLCGVMGPGAVNAQTTTLKTCWQPEHSTYIIWDPIQRGWDKEVGLKIEMIYFDSGMAQMEALAAKQWVAGATGSVPMLVGAMRFGAYMIAIANDDSLANAVLVRPNSPILNAKGINKDFPETFGSPETVKGKTVLVTTVSSGHYALSTWLKRIGLKDTGCYGHNGSDDAALDAALLARAVPRRPVLLKWSRQDEHAFEPYRPAMQVDGQASVDPQLGSVQVVVLLASDVTVNIV